MGNYLLQSYLDNSWSACRDKPALVDETRSLNYEMLRAGSNRIAGYLAAKGVKRQDRVVICMRRSSLVVMAMLGILKADAIYVPVDAKIPLERLLKIVESCRPSVILYDESLMGTIEGNREILNITCLLLMIGRIDARTNAIEIICAEGGGDPLPFQEPATYRNIDVDAAYILYTSGSTGTPKGVAVSHQNVINYIEWGTEYFNIGPEERILGTAPFHFDMSTFDIFTVLKAGATLYIAPERYLLFPNKLLDLIEENGITLWKGVSSLLMYMSTTGCLKKDRIPTLRKVLFGGEVLPAKHLMNWMNTYPEKLFYNVYGPTEATGISACYPVVKAPSSAEESIPIGTACSNTEILLLTEEDRLARPGETGELCIRGSGLSLGYWNEEDRNATAFIPNPAGRTPSDRIYRTGDLGRLREDGALEYLGRKDFQVKVMGYRIELLEIEKAIVSLGTINHAAVLLLDSSNGEVPELIAFVEGEETIEQEGLIRDLSRLLPSYMLPKKVVQLPEIPLNDRGKTDRHELRDYYRRLVQVPISSSLNDSPIPAGDGPHAARDNR